MTWIKHACKHLTPALVVFAFLAMAGCEGSDTREKVNDTVEELAGKKFEEGEGANFKISLITILYKNSKL